jgi:hypothetical protein
LVNNKLPIIIKLFLDLIFFPFFPFFLLFSEIMNDKIYQTPSTTTERKEESRTYESTKDRVCKSKDGTVYLDKRKFFKWWIQEECESIGERPTSLFSRSSSILYTYIRRLLTTKYTFFSFAGQTQQEQADNQKAQIAVANEESKQQPEEDSSGDNGGVIVTASTSDDPIIVAVDETVQSEEENGNNGGVVVSVDGSADDTVYQEEIEKETQPEDSGDNNNVVVSGSSGAAVVVPQEELEKEVTEFISLMPSYNKPPKRLEVQEYAELVAKRLGIVESVFDDDDSTRNFA